jgi:hypothetical protein
LFDTHDCRHRVPTTVRLRHKAELLHTEIAMTPHLTQVLIESWQSPYDSVQPHSGSAIVRRRGKRSCRQRFNLFYRAFQHIDHWPRSARIPT